LNLFESVGLSGIDPGIAMYLSYPSRPANIFGGESRRRMVTIALETCAGLTWQHMHAGIEP
jgi:hypothetical protein